MEYPSNRTCALCLVPFKFKSLNVQTMDPTDWICAPIIDQVRWLLSTCIHRHEHQTSAICKLVYSLGTTVRLQRLQALVSIRVLCRFSSETTSRHFCVRISLVQSHNVSVRYVGGPSSSSSCPRGVRLASGCRRSVFLDSP